MMKRKLGKGITTVEEEEEECYSDRDDDDNMHQQYHSDGDDMNSNSSDGNEDDYDSIAIGVECNSDIVNELIHATSDECGIDFVCSNLVHPRKRRDGMVSSSRTDPLSRSDLILDAHDWSHLVIGKLSDWIPSQLSASSRSLQYAAEIAMIEEYDYACYLGLQGMLLPNPIYCRDVTNYGRCILSLCNKKSIGGEITPNLIQFYLKISLLSGHKLWNDISHSMQYPSELHIALELSEIIPRSVETIDDCKLKASKWLSEPVKCIIIPSRLFNTSIIKKKKLVSLPSQYRIIVEILMSKFSLQFIITGVDARGSLEYKNAIVDVWQKKRDAAIINLTLYEKFVRKYRNSLRSPLQPLMNNLECNTYRVMEEDPVKYQCYGIAIMNAMRDINSKNNNISSSSSSSSSSSKKSKIKNGISPSASKEIIVCIIGAGRGPLIKATVKAAVELQISNYRIVVVEKNRNAVNTLRSTQRSDPSWKNVTIICSDIRVVTLQHLAMPDKVDLMVSELLGSFGDNELSPECIDIARRSIVKEDGIIIPQSYTSYASLISSTKLWMNARGFQYNDEQKSFETPYVVHMYNARVMSSSKEIFHFSHIDRINVDKTDNTRYASVTFNTMNGDTSNDLGKGCNNYSSDDDDDDDDDIIHGIGGFFKTVLYKEIELSTVPESHSEGMFSWFPMFFPLKSPIRVRGAGAVTVSFWRMNDKQRVWYEWQCSYNNNSTVTDIHNINGRSYYIGL